MPDIPHQHENERILYRTRRSPIALFATFFPSLWQGMIAGVIAGLIVGGAWYFAFGTFSAAFVSVLVILTIMGLALRRSVIWRNTLLTITSQRIIYHHYDSLLKAATHTVRWDRIQDTAYEAGMLGRLANTGTLTVYYGTLDAERSLPITGLRWARDLKHYLDKIQSLRAAKTPDANLPQFVPAGKRKRDRAVRSYVDGTHAQ